MFFYEISTLIQYFKEEVEENNRRNAEIDKKYDTKSASIKQSKMPETPKMPKITPPTVSMPKFK